MTVTRREAHTFLGIDIKFLEDGTSEISMEQYIKECIESFGVFYS